MKQLQLPNLVSSDVWTSVTLLEHTHHCDFLSAIFHMCIAHFDEAVAESLLLVHTH